MVTVVLYMTGQGAVITLLFDIDTFSSLLSLSLYIDNGRVPLAAPLFSVFQWDDNPFDKKHWVALVTPNFFLST